MGVKLGGLVEARRVAIDDLAREGVLERSTRGCNSLKPTYSAGSRFSGVVPCIQNRVFMLWVSRLSLMYGLDSAHHPSIYLTSATDGTFIGYSSGFGGPPAQSQHPLGCLLPVESSI